MKLPILDNKGTSQGEVEVGFELIENGRGTQAVHDAVVAYNAAQRSGTACAKRVGEVAGTNKKPWRQKGTGRARAGSTQSPLWPGGGVVFGPLPRDYAKKVNKKVRSLALRKALSERLKSGDVVVVDDLKLATPRTKEFLGVLGSLKLAGNTVLLVAGEDKNLTLASRNVPNVELTSGEKLNTYETLLCDKLVFTKAALEKVALRLSDK
ncbi:MAG: 50S ribosomal protein L4 [Proteobacteria bacterium]|nr:50S ribosomal protein L4 [Verrucomicrobiota bacterium]NBU11677.1 50S ribosomal protein L4 [Pseudomonadota bacterium]